MHVPLLLLTLASVASQPRHCPVSAATALPELIGTWQIEMTGGLDRPNPTSASATATIGTSLDGCVLREQVVGRDDSAPYEALVLWAVNGPDDGIQLVFVHSQHGRIGLYQGPRRGDTIVLRQLDTRPEGVSVENRVEIRDSDHFEILSQISTNDGASWTALSRWRYERSK